MKKETDEKNEKNKKTLKIDIEESIAQGNYSNLNISNFNEEEFILDFGFIQPHTAKAQINSRIILSPQNAKRLAEMLSVNIKNYESKFGNINKKPLDNGFQINMN